MTNDGAGYDDELRLAELPAVSDEPDWEGRLAESQAATIELLAQLAHPAQRIEDEKPALKEKPFSPSRSCIRCGVAITGRRDRKYCGDACRSAASREERRARIAELADVLDPAVAEATLVQALFQVAQTSPRWAAWLLERRFPERWGPLTRRTPREHEPDFLG